MRLFALLTMLLMPLSLFAGESGFEDIERDTKWSGEIAVTKPLHVLKDANLQITPGTKVTFDIPSSEEFEPAPWILLEGSIEIGGTASAPVIFKVANKTVQKSTQDMFNLLAAKSAKISYGHFIGAGWALHIHDTPTLIENSRFMEGYGGIRSSSDNLEVSGSVFSANKIGMRLLNAEGVTISSCDFSENLTGIFLRQGIRDISIAKNYFANAEYDIKLGELQEEDVNASSNWWMTSPALGGVKIFDGKDSAGVGLVKTDPELDLSKKTERRDEKTFEKP